MNTKNPFLFDGLSASVKLGERFMNEYAVRYAKVFKDDEGRQVCLQTQPILYECQ